MRTKTTKIWTLSALAVLVATLAWMAPAMANTPGLPIQATDIATKWDALYNFLVALSVFFFVLVVGAMLYFVFKYRAKPGVKTKYIADHHLIEGVWTFVPFVLLMVIFVWGYALYNKMVTAPSNAMEIQVTGKQWLWQFQYDDGRTTIGEIYVPVNQPVRLKMSSTDVLHSFFIPNFRVKQDVVPGMYSSVWFEATVPGEHQVFCTEYCGGNHSGMLAKLIALGPEDWENWKRGKKILASHEPEKITTTSAAAERAGAVKAGLQLTLVEQGKAHFTAKGCVACHAVDGAAKGNLGPALKGIYGAQVDLVSGSKAIRDDNYLRESIENPMAKVVKGYNPVMPTFKGQVSEMEMNALIAFIRSLK